MMGQVLSTYEQVGFANEHGGFMNERVGFEVVLRFNVTCLGINAMGLRRLA